MCDDVNVNCQQLLANEPICHGWVKIKRKIHEIDIHNDSVNKLAKKLANAIKWERKYFILCGPVIYIFKEETSKAADRILRLIEFYGVRETSVEGHNIPWPIEMHKKMSEKCFIFAPISERERKKWIECLKNELQKLPSIDDERASRPLPTVPNSISKKQVGNYLKSLTETDDDDEQNDYESPDTENYESADAVCNNSNNNKKTKFIENEKVQGIAKEIEQRKNSINQSTLPKRVPPQIIFPKPSNSSQKSATLPKEAKHPPIMKIQPIIRNNSLTKQDDGIYEIEYERDQKADIGFWKGSTEEATNLIKSLIDQEGTFLIRNSTEADGYTLLVVNEKVIRKFPIKKEGSQLSMGGKTYSNFEQLVSFHTKNDLPQKDFKLRNPYSYYKK